MVIKIITLQEANGLLPLVRERFFHMQVLISHLNRLKTIFAKRFQEKLIVDQNREEIFLVEKHRNNKRRRKKNQEINRVEALIEKEITELTKLGAITKSLFPAHVDFLSNKNGQPVFLCWHGHEKEISHWHYIDDSHPKRQTIVPDKLFGPQVVH